VAVVLATPCRDSIAGPAPRLAVFEIEAKRIKLPRDVVSDLRDYLEQGLAASRVFRLVPKDQLRKALVKEKQRSYKVCFAKTCQIEVGRALSADHSLATTLTRFGTKCVVSATLYNLKTEVTEGGAQVKGKCGVEQIMGSMDKVVAGLTGRTAAPPASVSETPSPPDEGSATPPPLPGEREGNPAAAPPPEPAPAKANKHESAPRPQRFKLKILLKRTKASGRSWDAKNGRPDILFFLDGERSSVYRNTFQFAGTFVSSKSKGPWRITIRDKDALKDDFVGEGMVGLGDRQLIGQALVSITR